MFPEFHSYFCIKLRGEKISIVRSSFFEGLVNIALLKFHAIVFISDRFIESGLCLGCCYQYLMLH